MVFLVENPQLECIGVTADAKLTFDSHLRKCAKSESQIFGIMNGCESLFHRYFLRHIQALLEYCSSVFVFCDIIKHALRHHFQQHLFLSEICVVLFHGNSPFGRTFLPSTVDLPNLLFGCVFVLPKLAL